MPVNIKELIDNGYIVICDTGQQGSLLPCWTMQNGRTSIRLSSVP